MLASATAVTAMTPIIPKRRAGNRRRARVGVGQAGAAATGACMAAGRGVAIEGAALIDGAVAAEGAVAGETFAVCGFSLVASGVPAETASVAAPGISALPRVAAFISGTRISLAASVAVAVGFFSGVNASTGVSVEICPAAARLALISASASSAARDSSCMSSGLRTISMVSSSRLS